jgi:hypothetical protein
MHSTSEAREAQIKLTIAEEDIRKMYERQYYIIRSYYKDLQLMLMDLGGMTPEEASIKSREWLENQRPDHNASEPPCYHWYSRYGFTNSTRMQIRSWQPAQAA